ncbi:MAG: S8 family serine peptidase [candidate division Zixibacteria bacterium]|nr:S8 family serine peptidase [candidate division Zixibacteria bacterium]
MSTLRVISGIALFFLLFSQIQAANEFLIRDAVTIEKETDNRIDAVKIHLLPREIDGKVKVWVYFTDKGIFDKNSFEDLAATIKLTERTQQRRKKMGLEDITFLDLPVKESYVEEIKALGGKTRRISKWLNAASFEINLLDIDQINALPFVARIRPVAVFKRDDISKTYTPPEPGYTPTDKDTHFLNYGDSQGQLDQINVPVVHDKGHIGTGAIVAMLDTGYRKDHEAFADAYSEGRVLAEWDFVFDDGNTQNETEDVSDQHRHGTLTWSTLGGAKSGDLYGPAYGASFILAKTEDVRSETQVEEDNWAAAVEWADSIGANVISSSLGYSDWYTYSDFDGETATITIAANLAASLGIVVVTSMGNSGPGAGSLTAPSDAFESVSVGAISSSGAIASFSSRGPTYDGRTKPEIVAQGVTTRCASPTTTISYTYANGTSLSCPLAGGCAAVILGVHPEFTPTMVRQALIETASQSQTPDNIYGWGIIDLGAALSWGAKIGADITIGQTPLSVTLYDSSAVTATTWSWSLGDGDSAFVENPVHTYNSPGVYSVGLSIGTAFGNLGTSRDNYIVALADTLTISSDSVYAGSSTTIDFNLTNSQELSEFTITFNLDEGANITLDSITYTGLRTETFTKTLIGTNSGGTQQAIKISQNPNPLSVGSGSVMRLHLTTDQYAFGGNSTIVDTVTIGGKSLDMTSALVSYQPYTISGEAFIRDVLRGDANHDNTVNVGDAVYIVNYAFKGGPTPVTIESGDANTDFTINVGDAVYIIDYVFKGGPPPIDL